MKNWIIAALVAVIATGGALSALAATQTVNQPFEIRVWEDVNDPTANYISARPEGGSWRTLGTISIPLTDGVSSTGRFRYGDIKLDVPVTVEVPDPPSVASETPSSSSDELSQTDTAVLWVTIADNENSIVDWLDVSAQIGGGAEAFKLDVHISTTGGRTEDACFNADRMYDQEIIQLSCLPSAPSHTAVNRVRATLEGENILAAATDFRCERHNDSTDELSVWACETR
ncbi:MAG: hypothetical protein OXH07_11405 [Chloroflexi bacterium]|nr:hypothetical protein [Chloroflexota bacterium]